MTLRENWGTQILREERLRFPDNLDPTLKREPFKIISSLQKRN